MNIGIDVDGVLVDLDGYQKEHGRAYFGKAEIDDTRYDVQESFGVSRKERQAFWRRWIWRYCISEPVRENAPEVISRLRAEGHKIHIITGRVYVTQKGPWGALFRHMLFSWLKRNGIVYNEMALCTEKNSAEDKMLACQKYAIDVMIEDKRENVCALSQITKVLCFDARYNRDCEGKNIMRVYSFDEVYEIISNMQAMNA